MPKASKTRSDRSLRRDRQIKALFEEGSEMRPCSGCICRGVRCVAHRDSQRCAECVRSESSCDLVVTAEDWDILDKERERLRKEIAKRRQLVSTAQRELEQLEEAQEKLRTRACAMIAREAQNLEEMEVDNQRGGLNSPPVSVSFLDLDFSDPALAALVDDPSLLPFDLGSFGGSHSREPGNA